MQPAPTAPPYDANGTAIGGGPPPPPQQAALNITAVHNATGVNPSMLGNWTMETSDRVQSQANITLRLQRRMPPMQVTPENHEILNFATQTFSPTMRSLRVGAEAVTADFTVTDVHQQKNDEPQNYHLDGFADNNRIALGAISPDDRHRLQYHSSRIVSQATLNAMEVLTDADVTVETHAGEQTLTAKKSLKTIIFRRPIAAQAPQDPPLSAPQQETGAVGGQPAVGQAAAESPHDREIKQQLLNAIVNSDYHFNPDDHTGNCTKLKQQWTLCYYKGTTPVPPNDKTTLKIFNLVLEVAASPLYANFRQPHSHGEDSGVLALNRARVTFTNENVYGGTDGPLKPLPEDTQSLPQMFTNGVTLLHLDHEKFVVISEDGEVLGFAKLDEPPEQPEQE